MTRNAFVRVGNAGHSGVATASAERERTDGAETARRAGLTVRISGGVHGDVIEVPREAGIDLSGRIDSGG